jgi:hypothetical protein
MDLSVELRRIVEALDHADVRYALAGGLAVSIYTAPRATEDIDLFLERENLPRAIAALLPLGFRIAGELMRVARGRLEIQRLIKIEGQDLLPVDLLVPVDPALAALAQDAVSMPWEGRHIVVVGLDSLRTLKRLRGSAQDRADLEALGPDPA